ncbi:YihY/virulence factor BrkB family protein [Nocardioides sp. R-C-SC26]|uniref:YihY/virulence factor BrkB family protein n=1 Tax=Nocardioides sp. R-C-SC26 TaxID=2870414 RepID=UPI001E540A53|nr:YihY/virulence factor BrkB family protein [Nocardioides sp. R-C-SC26]
MAGLRSRLQSLRERHPALDHVFSMNERFGTAQGSQQAGAVTYFAFLSFFPILALAFFVVGYISTIWPDANDSLVSAIDSVLPGVVGERETQLSLDDVRSFSGFAGLIGLIGVLYSGLGWVSALREALTVMFDLPPTEQPSWIVGKLRDLAALALIGVVLLVTVAVAGFVGGFSADIVDWLGFGSELGWVVKVLVLLVGLAANVVLFFAVFKLLTEPDLPRRSLWQGAVLGAIGFEVLKQFSGLLLSSTKGQPAFQAFGIALILLVWINYFSRLVLYAAAWAYTTPEARAHRQEHPREPVHGPSLPPAGNGAGPTAPIEDALDQPGAGPRWIRPFAAGAGAMLALVGVVRRVPRRR